MNTLLIIAQVPIFVALFIAYVGMLESLFLTPAILVRIAMLLWWKARGKDVDFLRGQVRWARINAITEVVLGVATLAAALYFRLWEWPVARIWENPILLAVLLFVSVLVVSNINVYLPWVRQTASGYMIVALTTPIVVLLGVLAPSWILETTFMAAFLLAIVVLLLVSVLYTLPQIKKVRSFEEIDDRHDVVGEELVQLQRIVDVLGDVGSWRTVHEVVRHVEDRYQRALAALRDNKLREADALVIEAEMEVKEIQQTLDNRLRLSLKDELASRLEQAGKELDQLETEFLHAGLGVKTLASLRESAKTLTAALADTEFTSETLLEQIMPFEEFFLQIIQTRTALRCRQNVGHAITALHDEVDSGNQTIRVADGLGLTTEAVRSSREDIKRLLSDLPEKPVQSSEVLVSDYQTLQQHLKAFRTQVAVLEQELKRGWVVKTLESGWLSVYVPKSCSTSGSTRGAIYIRGTPGLRAPVAVELDGSLLKLQANRSLAFEPPRDGELAVQQFTFAGERGGKAVLIATIKGDTQPPPQLSFDLRVMPTFIEAAGQFLAFGTPIGAVTTAAFWHYLGLAWSEAIPLGAAVGAVVGFLIAYTNYLKYRR